MVHLVNIDLPLENRALLKATRETGAMVALSTVHHPVSGVEAFYASDLDRFFAGARLIGLTADRAVGVREMAKLVRRGSVAQGISGLRGVSASQTALAAEVDLLLPMARSEKQALEADLGLQEGGTVVPNGITFDPMSTSTDRDIDLVVVGRVEPRKNTLALARAVRKAGLRAVFAGAINGNHGAYVQAFLKEVSNSDRMSYVGSLPHADVRELLSRSRYYLNGAWFEVVSQADMEAASCGCRVLTTKYGYSSEFIDVGPGLIDPVALNGRSGAEYLLQLLNAVDQPTGPPSPFSWRDAAIELVQAYESTI
ncbi:glycosyltransferase [Modestobacter sp. SYSU DS0657]